MDTPTTSLVIAAIVAIVSIGGAYAQYRAAVKDAARAERERQSATEQITDLKSDLREAHRTLASQMTVLAQLNVIDGANKAELLKHQQMLLAPSVSANNGSNSDSTPTSAETALVRKRFSEISSNLLAAKEREASDLKAETAAREKANGYNLVCADALAKLISSFEHALRVLEQERHIAIVRSEQAPLPFHLFITENEKETGKDAKLVVRSFATSDGSKLEISVHCGRLRSPLNLVKESRLADTNTPGDILEWPCVSFSIKNSANQARRAAIMISEKGESFLGDPRQMPANLIPANKLHMQVLQQVSDSVSRLLEEAALKSGGS